MLLGNTSADGYTRSTRVAGGGEACRTVEAAFDRRALARLTKDGAVLHACGQRVARAEDERATFDGVAPEHRRCIGRSRVDAEHRCPAAGWRCGRRLPAGHPERTGVELNGNGLRPRDRPQNEDDREDVELRPQSRPELRQRDRLQVDGSGLADDQRVAIIDLREVLNVGQRRDLVVGGARGTSTTVGESIGLSVASESACSLTTPNDEFAIRMYSWPSFCVRNHVERLVARTQIGNRDALDLRARLQIAHRDLHERRAGVGGEDVGLYRPACTARRSAPAPASRSARARRARSGAACPCRRC